jgi:hypothetical protein
LKEYNKTRKYKQKKHREETLESLDNMRSSNPSEYWKLLKSLDNESSPRNPAKEIDVTNWSSYFEKLIKNKNKKPSEWKEEVEKMECSMPPSILDSEISLKEIQTSIKALKNKKAPGLDQISNEMIKYSQHVMLPLLHKLFKLVLKSGCYPKEWAEGYITPIYKSGDPLSKDNYRGITISSCLGKLFNSVLNTRLDNFLTQRNVLSETQIGYKKGSRPSDHIFVLKSLVDKIVKLEKKKLYTCFVDFRKAYDTVDRDALFFKMLSNGVTGNFYKLIKDMYNKTSL